MMTSDHELIADLYAEFDRLNSADPKTVQTETGEVPFQLFHSRELTSNIHKLTSSPSIALLLAARSQHLLRFTKPRSSYPEGKAGYHKWKNDLKAFHAEKTSEILQEHKCAPELIDRVNELNRKVDLKTDPECQALEDALCLFFLEHQYEEFVRLYPEDKLITILQKSWAKMSENGHLHALQLNYSPEGKRVIEKALQG